MQLITFGKSSSPTAADFRKAGRQFDKLIRQEQRLNRKAYTPEYETRLNLLKAFKREARQLEVYTKVGPSTKTGQLSEDGPLHKFNQMRFAIQDVFSKR